MDSLYYPTSLVVWKRGSRPIPIIWFVGERTQLLTFHGGFVQGYDDLPATIKYRTYQMIQEMLTHEEMRVLRNYLQSNLQYQTLEGKVSLPMNPIRHTSEGDGFVMPYRLKGEHPNRPFYKISQREDYPFDFKIWGYWVNLP